MYSQGWHQTHRKLKLCNNGPLHAVNVADVQKFLGLASYYRRYIPHFSDIASPLNSLTQKGVAFQWNQDCQEVFQLLKRKLVESPILTFPKFHQNGPVMVLQTDASATGLGAVLEQDGHVIAPCHDPNKTTVLYKENAWSGCCVCTEAIPSLSFGTVLPSRH